MCKKCEETKAAKNTQPVIGKVSPQLRADFLGLSLAIGNAELDIEQMVLDGKRDFLNGRINEAEAEKRQELIEKQQEAAEAKLEETQKSLWNRVYDELGIVGIDKHLGYSIDAKTGEIRRAVEKEKHPLDLLGKLLAGAAEVHVLKKD